MTIELFTFCVRLLVCIGMSMIVVVFVVIDKHNGHILRALMFALLSHALLLWYFQAVAAVEILHWLPPATIWVLRFYIAHIVWLPFLAAIGYLLWCLSLNHGRHRTS